jgi:hypothetical protein
MFTVFGETSGDPFPGSPACADNSKELGTVLYWTLVFLILAIATGWAAFWLQLSDVSLLINAVFIMAVCAFLFCATRLAATWLRESVRRETAPTHRKSPGTPAPPQRDSAHDAPRVAERIES